MNRETQSLVMLLVGGATLRISLTDVYLRYVKEGLRPFLIVAAVILLVIGAVTLWREIADRMRADRDQPDLSTADAASPLSRYDGKHRSGVEAVASHDGRSSGHEHSSGHNHAAPWVAWLLVLPVFAIFLIAPASLGSYAADRAGTSIAAPDGSDYPPLPLGDVVSLTVLDYATRAVFEGDASLQDRTVKLTGFTSRREGGGVRLNRIILSCCAADGRPVKITLVGELPRKLPADTWVEVQGRYDVRTDTDSANGEKIPYLQVISLRGVDKPTNSYES
ncbi:MAG: TIGR03943 family putative permease subunit [Mycobacteriales bacterium]